MHRATLVWVPVLLAACGDGRAQLRDEHFPHRAGPPDLQLTNAQVYLSTKLDRRERAWAQEAVREHARAYQLLAAARPLPRVRVFVYGPRVQLLQGLQRGGVPAYSLPAETHRAPGGVVSVPPEIHVTVGPEISLPALQPELHQVATEHRDPWRQDPRMGWALVVQSGQLTADQIQARRP